MIFNKKSLILIINIILLISLSTGCREIVAPTISPIITKNPNKIDYSMLTNAEKSKYDEIKKTIKNNEIYKIKFESNIPKFVGEIRYDFNNDGNIDILNCSIIEPSGFFAEKVKLSLNGKKIEKDTQFHGAWEVFSEFGIMDADTKDDYVEFYITEGYVGGGVAYVYRLTDKGITETDIIQGGIEGLSGDGKIYYWGGNLFDVYNEKFNRDLVVSYYDINKKEKVRTNQIIGKIITAKERIIVFKTMDDVFGDQDQESLDSFENIIKKSEGKIITILEIGDTFQVLNLDEETQIKTSDEKVGWIGGFNVTYD